MNTPQPTDNQDVRKCKCGHDVWHHAVYEGGHCDYCSCAKIEEATDPASEPQTEAKASPPTPEPTGKFCSTNCCINKALYYYDQCEEHLVTPEPVELEKVFVFENDHTFESLGSAPFNVLQCKHCDKFASHHLAYATRSTLTTLINKEVERKSLEARIDELGQLSESIDSQDQLKPYLKERITKLRGNK